MSTTKIQQTQMSGSLAFDDALDISGSDYLQKAERTLVDDLNALRTQIKSIQGTDAWTDGLEGTQDLAEIYAAMHVNGADADFQGELKVTNDALVSGSLEVAGFVEFLDNLKIGGDLQIMGDDLSGSLGGNMRFEGFGKVVVAGDLQVSGDVIEDSLGHAMVTFDAAGGSAEVDADLGVTGELSVDTGVVVLTDGVSIDSSVVAGQLDLTADRVKMSGDLQVMGDYISGSNGLNLSLMSGGEVKVEGDLIVGGNDIKSWDSINETSTVAITLSGDDVTVAGEMTVTGNVIHGSAAEALEFSAGDVGMNVEVKGDLQVTGDDIKSSSGNVAISLDDQDVDVKGDLTVDGDLIVKGTTTSINTTNLEVKDAIVGFGYTIEGELQADGDRGFIFARDGAGENVAAFWDDSAEEFRLAFTDNGPSDDSINVDVEMGYVNFRANNVVAEGNITAEGDLTVNGNDIYGSEGLNISFEADGRVLVAGEFEVMGDHISGSNGLNISLLSGGDVEIKGDLVVVGNQISGSGGVGHLTLQADGDVRVAGELEVAGGFVTLSNGSTIDSTVAGTLTITEDVVALSGDLKVGGNDIKASDGAVALTLTDTLGDVKVAGDLTVGGNDIKSWDGETATTAMTLSGDDVEVKGELKVSGDVIKSSAGDTVFTLAGANATVEGNLVVDGDFVVNGAMTIVNTNNLVVKDAIVGLGYVSGANGPEEIPAEPGDRGFVFSRFGVNNVATFWDDTDSKFKMVYTTSGPEATEISENGYADFHAGIVSSQAGFSGSLTKLVDNTDYLIAGVGITLSTGSNGAITISGASNSYAKGYFGNGDLTGASSNVLTFSSLGTLSAGAALDKNVDVYLNGALLAYGEGRDVTGFTTTTVTLNATLAASLIGDDVITVVLRSLA